MITCIKGIIRKVKVNKNKYPHSPYEFHQSSPEILALSIHLCEASAAMLGRPVDRPCVAAVEHFPASTITLN